MTKLILLDQGQALLQRFCAANQIPAPAIDIQPKAGWRLPVCAYYRAAKISICPEACAAPGTFGRAWSHPGYTVDRTPYGVLQHELGHHVDVLNSTVVQKYQGDFSKTLRQATGEPPISGYCPDDGEWFAEIFRLFVTNPDLLRELRPRTWTRLRCQFTPVIDEPWSIVLAQAPDRTRQACANKIALAPRCQGAKQ